MEKQVSFKGVPAPVLDRKHPNNNNNNSSSSSQKKSPSPSSSPPHPPAPAPAPAVATTMEKHPSFRGLILDKQKSFRLVMERQLSFLHDKIMNNSNNSSTKDSPSPSPSPGKRGDTLLHSAARSGNLTKLRQILNQTQTSGGSSSSSSRLPVLDPDSAAPPPTPSPSNDNNNNNNKDLLGAQNHEGETPLYAAADNGHASLVAEMLPYMDLRTASLPARNGFDPFHVAAKHGHLDVLKELLRLFPNLVMTTDLSCTTALHTAATKGHIDVVNLLLDTDSNLLKIARNNGKTVLHSAARMGHLEVVRSILTKDPSAASRTDKKGQTALHMAVKGQIEEIVLQLLKPDPTVITLEDNKGNTPLHIATKKGRTKNVRCLLSIDGIDINAVNRDGETALDIAEKLGIPELVSVLKEAGAANSKDNGKPPSAAKQLKQTVSDIKHDVQSQLQQTRQTGASVQKIAKRLKKLHISGLNNAINSSTVVAVLIATVAFAAIFTVPGQYVEDMTEGEALGQARIAKSPAFLVFFVFDSLALFISLAVVVVQTSVVVIEQKAKKQLVFVINKLMWLACVFISVAFISLTYVVVGKKFRWLAIYATVIGGSIMLTTIGSMCYCVVLHRMEETKLRNIRRAESRSHSYSISMPSDPEILNSEYKRMYAL